MRIMGANKGRTGLAITIAALVVTGVSLTAWHLVSENDISVEGGYILHQDSECVKVRCLSPDVSLHLEKFTGQVELVNCFPDTQIQGYEGDVERNGARMTIHISEDVEELRLTVPEKQSFRFAVLGDSQGKNDILAQILDSLDGCEFVIHCGDLTPSGADSEFAAVEETLNASRVPVFTTPGNHDARLGDLRAYESRFGPANYAFTYSGLRFVFVDSSDQSITEQELKLAREDFGDANKKIMVTHVPSYDPFGSNHTLDELSCERVQSFAMENELSAVYTGHVHAFHILEVEGTDFMITGGAGGALVDGVHHHVVVTADDLGLSHEKVDLTVDWTRSPHLSLMGRNGQVLNLTFDQLAGMELMTAYSSFENQFNNIRGAGVYSGPSVASLIELVGGMEDGDTLTVVSSDGYSQEFGYLNVHASEEWLAIQGTMILAMEYEGAAAPEWEEGPRLAFLAPDGLYSNSDCEATSYEGQGYYLYPSAGARWVSCVASFTVEAGA
ncbi:MAG: metallophosphoesterase [Candidatus Thermoplasmatota archaeon]|nr:metallophosphoesterase [Candidatus Thermoplasmatota archaeon]